jgi:FkbM family methyltransferase
MFDDLIYRVSENRRLRRLLTPLLRAYLRYAPVAAGKASFWDRVVDPYFAWHSHDFVASTVFQSKIAGNTGDLIQQCIYYFGLWEPYLTHWIARRLARGDTFIDVGANIGYFALLASRRVGSSGAVVAIEASPRTFRALRENLARNRAGNVRAVNVAASGSPGVLRLFRGPKHNIGETTTLPQPDFELECEVEAAPLSAILRPEEVRKARLVKIDVEGAEWSVVAGMGPLLRSCPPRLEFIVEVHPEYLAQQGRRPQDILEVFREAGFHAYQLEKDLILFGAPSGRAARKASRLREPFSIEEETDLVFSRRDADCL